MGEPRSKFLVFEGPRSFLNKISFHRPAEMLPSPDTILGVSASPCVGRADTTTLHHHPSQDTRLPSSGCATRAVSPRGALGVPACSARQLSDPPGVLATGAFLLSVHVVGHVRKSSVSPEPVGTRLRPPVQSPPLLSSALLCPSNITRPCRSPWLFQGCAPAA